MKPFNCPFCGAHTEYKNNPNSSHIWSCSACPFIAFEFVNLEDLEYLNAYIQKQTNTCPKCLHTPNSKPNNLTCEQAKKLIRNGGLT